MRLRGVGNFDGVYRGCRGAITIRVTRAVAGESEGPLSPCSPASTLGTLRAKGVNQFSRMANYATCHLSLAGAIMYPRLGSEVLDFGRDPQYVTDIDQ